MYPVMLHLEGRRCVVVGGGRVAARKVRDLLQADASVTVISPALTPELIALHERRRIDVQLTLYQAGMLAALKPVLVFAATDSEAVNREVVAEAQALNILCCAVDGSDAGDFHSMATLRRGAVTVAVSTGGASPALAAHLRDEISGVVGEEYSILAAWLLELRPSHSAKAAFWRAVIASPILTLLREGDGEGARKLLDSLLADALERS